MQASLAARGVVVGAVALLSFSGVGCATKKHVRNVVAPVEARVGEVEKKTSSNSQSINELETNVSRVDEKATDAGRKATSAGEEAGRANQAAANASQQASDARSLAEKGLSANTQLAERMEDRIENLDNYQMVSTQTIHFLFNKWMLSKDAKDQLDQMVQNMSSMKHYVIEVEGFTDKSGSKDYNLELSRKRANEVVRYLTLQHNVPLRRIHVLGVGQENPANPGRGRTAAKENRRVEVKVFALQGAAPAGATTTGASAPGTGSTQSSADRTATDTPSATTQTPRR